MVGVVSKIGILGGTFDPPHQGHLALAVAARNSLGLDEVWFVPAGQPVHKSHQITPAKDRLAMTQLLVAPYPHFKAMTEDLDRPPPHYSLTLIPLLQAKQPQTEFWLIIGGDSLRDLDSWHQPESILEQVKLAVLPRPGVILDWIKLIKRFPTLPFRMRWLDGELHQAASSEIRASGITGRSQNVLTTTVAAYIEKHDLYREKQ